MLGGVFFEFRCFFICSCALGSRGFGCPKQKTSFVRLPDVFLFNVFHCASFVYLSCEGCMSYPFQLDTKGFRMVSLPLLYAFSRAMMRCTMSCGVEAQPTVAPFLEVGWQVWSFWNWRIWGCKWRAEVDELGLVPWGNNLTMVDDL